MVRRRICVSASAISGAVATKVWLSSDNCEAAIKAGKFVSEIWLKLAPNLTIARMATLLCVTANKPMAHREMESFDRAIDLRITRLRRKIERDPAHPDAIRNSARRGLYVRTADGLIAHRMSSGL